MTDDTNPLAGDPHTLGGILVCSEAAPEDGNPVPALLRFDAAGRRIDTEDVCSNCGAGVLVVLDLFRRMCDRFSCRPRLVCTTCAGTHLGWKPRTVTREQRRARAHAN